MKIEFTTPPSPKAEQRCMGGYVNFVTRGVKTDEPIFAHVEEKRLPGGAARIVKLGTVLDQVLRKKLHGQCVGNDPMIVRSAKDANEFTLEYKTGYGSPAVVADEEPEDEGEDNEDGNGS
jgi:hypothetical protein